MEQKKRVWEVLNSLEGMERAKAPEGGFMKIQQRLADHLQTDLGRENIALSSNHWLKVAAVITFLICANVMAVTQYLSPIELDDRQSSGYSQLLTDFTLYE